MRIVNYFDPRAQHFTACSDYNKLSHCNRGVVIALSIFAGITMLGVGGIAAFRALVERLKPLDSPTSPTDTTTTIRKLSQDRLSKNDLPPIYHQPIALHSPIIIPRITIPRINHNSPNHIAPCGHSL